jgi:hypothetical protein
MERSCCRKAELLEGNTGDCAAAANRLVLLLLLADRALLARIRALEENMLL